MAQCSEAESCPRDHMGTGGAERHHQKYSQHAAAVTMAAQSLDPPSRHQTTSADERRDSFAENMPILCLSLRLLNLDNCPFLDRMCTRLSGCNYGDQRICMSGPY